jgi:hypothetical protein
VSSRQRTCLLCGADTGEVQVVLVEWREPIGRKRYDHLPRCRDVDACWTRVTTVVGEDWPVADGRPARAPVQPEPPTEPPEAVVEEPSWLAG